MSKDNKLQGTRVLVVGGTSAHHELPR
ncbi:hypothetical protein MY11210_005913 [Beauveria gryllotalpidicola]